MDQYMSGQLIDNYSFRSIYYTFSTFEVLSVLTTFNYIYYQKLFNYYKMNYHKLSDDYSSFIAVIYNRDKRKLILQYLSNLIIKLLFVAAARIRNTPVSKLREELCAAWRDHTGCQGRWAALRFCIVIYSWSICFYWFT